MDFVSKKTVILAAFLCVASLLVSGICVFFTLRHDPGPGSEKPVQYVAPATETAATTTTVAAATTTVAVATTTTAPPKHQHVDYGAPLFLTPLIEEGKIAEAKELAAVGGYFSWVDSFAGYLTVNKQRKSNLFFWYFPEQLQESAPAILWLQGELGVSSSVGLFCEHGPFVLEAPDTIRRRKTTWTDSHHMIYVDSPVGTGYSFSDGEEPPRTSKQVVQDLHEAVMQLLQLFPNLQKSDFYVAGEHIGAKYAVMLAQKIASDVQKQKKRGTPPKVSINLAGIVIGNGIIDPIHQIVYADFLHGIGMIDNNVYTSIRVKEKVVLDCVKNHTSQCAYNQLRGLTEDVRAATGFTSLYNYAEPELDNEGLRCVADVRAFLHLPKVRKALHVGYLEVKSESAVVIEPVPSDYMESVSVLLPVLLDHHRVCIYSSQLDMLVPHVSTANYLERLKIPKDPIFHHAPRRMWRFGGDLAGYFKRGIRLFEVLVRNAGHMAASDQPERMHELIANFTHRRGFFED